MKIRMKTQMRRQTTNVYGPDFSAVVTTIGGRPYQEDRCFNGQVRDDTDVVAVFDGHGGHSVAEHCVSVMPLAIARVAASSESITVDGLSRAFSEVDRSATRALHVGSTACVVVFDRNNEQVWCANTGDSRALLASSGHAVPLSRDHKPENTDERRRIERQGGSVVHDGHCFRVQGVLNVSRVIGDWALRPYVTPLPEVARTDIHPGDSYILVASDGLWDVFSSEEAVMEVDAVLASRATLPPSRLAESALRSLVAEARRRGSSDNITVAIRGCAI